jgi:hypothetical protein
MRRSLFLFAVFLFGAVSADCDSYLEAGQSAQAGDYTLVLIDSTYPPNTPVFALKNITRINDVFAPGINRDYVTCPGGPDADCIKVHACGAGVSSGNVPWARFDITVRKYGSGTVCEGGGLLKKDDTLEEGGVRARFYDIGFGNRAFFDVSGSGIRQQNVEVNPGSVFEVESGGKKISIASCDAIVGIDPTTRYIHAKLTVANVQDNAESEQNASANNSTGGGAGTGAQNGSSGAGESGQNGTNESDGGSSGTGNENGEENAGNAPASAPSGCLPFAIIGLVGTFAIVAKA